MEQMLSAERRGFDHLMYQIMLIGVLAAIAVDILGTYVAPGMFYYNLAILPGIICGGALCHYFVHRARTYLAKFCGGFHEEYNKRLKENLNNGPIVVILNLVFVAILVVLMLRTWHILIDAFTLSHLNMPALVASSFGFVVGLFVFVFAKNLANYGWKEKSNPSGIT